MAKTLPRQPTGEPPVFLLQKNGEIVACKSCNSALYYPAILIAPGPPVPSPFKEKPGLIHWKWSYEEWCIKCARKRLKELKESDLSPLHLGQSQSYPTGKDSHPTLLGLLRKWAGLEMPSTG